jgi:hypothetical protein
MGILNRVKNGRGSATTRVSLPAPTPAHVTVPAQTRITSTTISVNGSRSYTTHASVQRPYENGGTIQDSTPLGEAYDQSTILPEDYYEDVGPDFSPNTHQPDLEPDSKDQKRLHQVCLFPEAPLSPPYRNPAHRKFFVAWSLRNTAQLSKTFCSNDAMPL